MSTKGKKRGHFNKDGQIRTKIHKSKKKKTTHHNMEAFVKNVLTRGVLRIATVT